MRYAYSIFMKITKYVYNLYCSPCSIEREWGRTRAISRNLGILRPKFVNSALPILSFHSNQTLLIKSVFNLEKNEQNAEKLLGEFKWEGLQSTTCTVYAYGMNSAKIAVHNSS